MKTDNWPKDERIDWILFRSQLENVDFGDRVLKFERTNPQVYVRRMHRRDLFAAEKGIRHAEETARSLPRRVSSKCRRCLKQGLSNLQSPVKLYAQLAIESARSIDPLFNESLMALDVELSPNEHEDLVKGARRRARRFA